MGHDRRRILEILESHGRSLFALMTRLTLCEEVAEDLMQELFLKLCGHQELSSVLKLHRYA